MVQRLADVLVFLILQLFLWPALTTAQSGSDSVSVDVPLPTPPQTPPQTPNQSSGSGDEQFPDFSSLPQDSETTFRSFSGVNTESPSFSTPTPSSSFELFSSGSSRSPTASSAQFITLSTSYSTRPQGDNQSPTGVGEESSRLNANGLIGGVIGGVLALVIIAFLLFCFARRRRSAHTWTQNLEARGYEVEPRRWFEFDFRTYEKGEKRNESSGALSGGSTSSRPTLPIRKVRIGDQETGLESGSSLPTTWRSSLPFKSKTQLEQLQQAGAGWEAGTASDGYASSRENGSEQGGLLDSDDGGVDEALSVAEMKERIRLLQRQVTILSQNQRAPSIAGDEPPPLYSSLTADRLSTRT
ncbi:hypothetical protein FA15DRAFT_758793 [Coprinopsis marcescibilis]|uniref:Mid2 domain-containing protein n=1 Tax=Coprinopsis marcescibilis TaxID=230819 RepID=A0A5C3KLQ2_COPMA|nr:hypothetical protein FA15DRAFT_758793 [Coprinopsis marcescibilis]